MTDKKQLVVILALTACAPLILLPLAHGGGQSNQKQDPAFEMAARCSGNLSDTVTWLVHASESERKAIPIEIFVESQLPNADGYRLAVAEVIRAYFGGKFEVSTETRPLHIYISATDTTEIGRVRHVTVSVRSDVRHYFAIPQQRSLQNRFATGTFLFAEDGKMLVNYDDDQATQVVREMAYKVLSETLKKLEEAPDRGALI